MTQTHIQKQLARAAVLERENAELEREIAVLTRKNDDVKRDLKLQDKIEAQFEIINNRMEERIASGNVVWADMEMDIRKLKYGYKLLKDMARRCEN